MIPIRYFASLELSQQLEKLLYSFTSDRVSHAWFQSGKYFCENKEYPEGTPFIDVSCYETDFPIKRIGHAYMACELLDILPTEFDGVPIKIHREKGHLSWDVSYNTDTGNGKKVYWEQDENLANACAKMLITIHS